MTKKLLLKRHVMPHGEVFQDQNPTQFGPNAKNLYTREEVTAMTEDSYLILEAWQNGAHNGNADCLCRECLTRMRLDESVRNKSKGWVKVKEVTGMKSRTGIAEPDRAARQREQHRLKREDYSPNRDDQKFLAYQKIVLDRKFNGSMENNAGMYKHGTLIVTFDSDGWVCGITKNRATADSGKDPGSLASLLDSKYPVATESFRQETKKRIREAYRVLGIAESADDSQETSDLIEAWAQILGSREAGAAFVKGKGNTK